MGDGDDNKEDLRAAEMENLSLDISHITRNRISRDLLQRFMGSSSEYEAAKEEDEEIELNLGLSLGGRFGVDKSSNKLVRSSSIAECLPVVRDDNDAVATPPVAYTSLVRTSSLPVETEEEWRKRKELQTLRRMEAKRRRSEKQKILKGDKEGGGSGGGNGGNLILEERREIEVNLRAKLDGEKCLAAAKRWAGPPVRLSSWTAAAARKALLGGGIDVTVPKGKGSGGMKDSGQPMSQGSLESHGGSSSSISELENNPLLGRDEPSPASIQSLQEGSNQEVGSSGIKAKENMMESPSKRSYITKNRGKETGTSMMEDMPCVFTKGDGPNGKRVDGILYKYGKGEEVRIMCVCHGSFLSPAEFVKHAGGSDVDHPLKHIVVNPNSPSLL
ncbi:Ninja-family protein AFP1 [Forsythia ovata]|uniref:Ninja-family protein n=1 Tax=Forsythia ovata TaxID=205694 RepID=A0ABD1XCA1_9LAMI